VSEEEGWTLETTQGGNELGLKQNEKGQNRYNAKYLTKGGVIHSRVEQKHLGESLIIKFYLFGCCTFQ